MIYKPLISRILISVLTFLAFSLSAQEADIDAGKTLFKNQCAACHNKNMKDAMTGPALGGTQERWADYPREDLYAWVRNSQALISKGQARAVQLWNDNKPIVMNNFPALTDQEIENVLGYIDAVYTGKLGGAKVAGGAQATSIPLQEPEPDNTLLFVVLFVVLVFLAIVLARIVSNLNYMAQVQAGNTTAKRKSFSEILTSKGVISFIIFALVVLGGFTTVKNAINLGRQQGYMPDQPIKFSHVTHAGLNKIDCQYCHDGARRSKHSIIPAANTCMNCHRAIKKGSKYGTGELTKIFASIGFNPNTDQYLSDEENLSREDVEKIYKKWIADEYVKDKGSLGAEGERTIEEQWKGIVKALTDPDNGDDKIQGPIEWVKIHNLPDHVFFSHAQHVVVGKIQCQQCHGKIQEMEVVSQQAPLSMGWCVNCHRKTNVQFKDNPYYDTYKLYHEQMAKGTRDHVTVEEIGGTECQKCHY